MFQRLEKMKKHAFASSILFGSNNDSSIAGIWVWKGQENVFDLCDEWAIDSPSYAWTKLDSKSEACKKLVHQYWKWEVSAITADLLMFFDVSVLKKTCPCLVRVIMCTVTQGEDDKGRKFNQGKILK
jgi:hypothetical protein